jgi:maltose-binding protein MalE
MVVVLMTLAACSLPPALSSTPAAEAPPEATSAVAPPLIRTPVPRRLPSRPDGLLLWTTEQGNGLELVQQIAQDAGMRAGVAITVVPKESAALRLSLLTAASITEPLPDMIWGNQDDLADLLVDGQLQPVTLPGSAETYLPAGLASATADGKIWGQPLTLQGFLLLFYNKGLVQQVPATSDELIVQSRAANVEGRAGLVMGWNEAPWLLAWLNGFGGSPVSADGTQPTLNTPQMESALNVLKELIAAAPPQESDYGRSQRLFAAGQVAYAMDGDWALPGYRAPGNNLDVGIAPLPRVPATNRSAGSVAGGSYLMFYREIDPNRLTQVQTIASYMAETDVQVRLATSLGRLPATRAALSAPALANEPVLAAAAAQAESASGLPPTRAARCALRAIDEQLPPLLAGRIDQAESLSAMQRSAEACVGR